MRSVATLIRQWFAQPSARELLAPGSAAPEFELRDQDGRLVRSHDLRGGRYVLWFFPRAGTRECTQQGCAYRDRIRE
jgi:peroxiredoxin Q/BCP